MLSGKDLEDAKFLFTLIFCSVLFALLFFMGIWAAFCILEHVGHMTPMVRG